MNITDKHTVYVTSRHLNFEGVSVWFDDLVKRASEFIPKGASLSYEINVPRGKNFAIIWVDSSELVNVLVGLNPDGSLRLKEEMVENSNALDTDWYEPEKIMVKLPSLVPLPNYQEDWVSLVRYSVVPQEGMSTDTLFCSRVPEGITAQQITKEFIKFNVSGKKEQKIVVTVNKGKFNTARVKFPGTNDALFALQMRMFVKIGDSILKFQLSKK